MPFLNAARPLLSENDSLVVRITAAKDGAIAVLVEPHVKLKTPETDDPELAALQAALAMPLMLRFDADTTDLDAAMSEALASMATSRKTTVSALTAYEEAQAEARNQAALANKKKAEKAAKSKDAGKTASKPAAGAGKPLPAAAETKDTSSQPLAPAVAAPAAQPSMFE